MNIVYYEKILPSNGSLRRRITKLYPRMSLFVKYSSNCDKNQKILHYFVTIFVIFEQI